jgi:hypothetical protein
VSSGCGWRDGIQLCRIAVNILYKQLQPNDKGLDSMLGLIMGLATFHDKNLSIFMKRVQETQTLMDFLNI